MEKRYVNKLYIDVFKYFTSLVFLTGIWLPHGQIWTIIKGQPHPPDLNY